MFVATKYISNLITIELIHFIEVMSGVHNLCKLDYPIYCCSPFESKSVMVGGGGGALGPKTGVRNAVELLELDQRRNEVM